MVAKPSDFLTTPDQLGNFGPYGGRFVSETLMAALDELDEMYERLSKDLSLIHI